MKIRGFVDKTTVENSNNQDLIQYVGSLFNESAVEIVDLSTPQLHVSSEELTHLILLSVTKDFELDRERISALGLNKIPVFLLSTSETEPDDVTFIKKLEAVIIKNEGEVVAHFSLTHFKSNFRYNKAGITEGKQGIKDTTQFLTLIRKVNELKQGRFSPHFPADRFTCGIDPTRKFFGEVDGY